MFDKIEFTLKARSKSNLSKQLVFKLFMFKWMFPALGIPPAEL